MNLIEQLGGALKLLSILMMVYLTACESHQNLQVDLDRAVRDQNDCSFSNQYCSSNVELTVIKGKLTAKDGSVFWESDKPEGYKSLYKVKFKYFNHNTTHITGIEEIKANKRLEVD